MPQISADAIAEGDIHWIAAGGGNLGVGLFVLAVGRAVTVGREAKITRPE
jgi:hypothetical protein